MPIACDWNVRSLHRILKFFSIASKRQEMTHDRFNKQILFLNSNFHAFFTKKKTHTFTRHPNTQHQYQFYILSNSITRKRRYTELETFKNWITREQKTRRKINGKMYSLLCTGWLARWLDGGVGWLRDDVYMLSARIPVLYCRLLY